MRKSWIPSMLALAVVGVGSSVLSSPARAAVAKRALAFACGDACPYYPQYSGVYGYCTTNSSGGTNTYCTYYY